MMKSDRMITADMDASSRIDTLAGFARNDPVNVKAQYDVVSVDKDEAVALLVALKECQPQQPVLVNNRVGLGRNQLL